MAAPTVREIVAAIKTQLVTIQGLNVTDYAPGQITPPAAVVMVPPITYLIGLGARRPILDVPVVVLVSATLDRVGQLALADYADPDGDKSIAATIATDPTLGGVVGQAQVTTFEPLGSEDVGLLGYFGGRFSLRVTT